MKIDWKKAWKWILMLIGVIIAALVVAKVKRAFLGKVDTSVSFIPDKVDDTIIHVIKDDGGTIRVKLPKNPKGKQLKSKDVESVRIISDDTIIVEGKHEKVDRRNVSSIDNSALDSLGLSRDDNGG